MYCPECGKGTSRIYEMVAAKTITQRKPEPVYVCDVCLPEKLLGIIKRGTIVKVKLFRQ